MAKIEVNFTETDRSLHTAIRTRVFESRKSKTKRVGNADFRQQYLPEHDVQLLKLLSDNGLAEKFGSGDTEEQKLVCEQLVDQLKKVGQLRTNDSVYYRLNKLLKAETLDDLNYRNTVKKK